MASNKIYEGYSDQHMRAVIAYGKAADHKLYADSAHTVTMSAAVIEDAFKKGMLLVHDGTNFLRPVKLGSGKVTTVDGTNTVAGTEWSASVTE